MDVEDEVDRHAIVEAEKSKEEGTTMVLIAAPNPPLAWGVKVALKTDKKSLIWSAGIVAGRIIEKASVRRSAPI